MKILILAEFYSNYRGNFIPGLNYLKNELDSLGHEVYFAFSNKNLSDAFYLWEKPFAENNDVVLFDFASKNFVKDAANYIKRKHFGIVYYHFGSSVKLSQIKKRCPKDIVFYQHIHNSMYLKKNICAFFKRIRNLLFLDHKIVKICCSESILGSAKYIFPLSKFYVQHNAIDFSRLKKSANNNCDSFNILLFGHNYYIKGVDVAIDAVMNLSSKIDIHLDIVMGDNLEKNIAIIREKYSNLPNCISILKPTSNVSELYHSHQVFLNASIEEGMSYANIEAYYCGALFVCSDIPQNKEPNLPGVIYFEKSNIGSLENALLLAYDERTKYVNDLKYVEDNFSLKSWCDGILKIMNLRPTKQYI